MGTLRHAEAAWAKCPISAPEEANALALFLAPYLRMLIAKMSFHGLTAHAIDANYQSTSKPPQPIALSPALMTLVARTQALQVAALDVVVPALAALPAFRK